MTSRLDMVAHAYNPSCVGGTDWEDYSPGQMGQKHQILPDK
jgi:hypothetical protein